MTGAARGMGRNHALRLAREGASIIGVDVAADVSPHNGYPAAITAQWKPAEPQAKRRLDLHHPTGRNLLPRVTSIRCRRWNGVWLTCSFRHC